MTLGFAAAIAVLLAPPAAVPAALDEMPLAVKDVSYQTGEKFVRFTLQNDGPVAVIAWQTYITATYPDGSRAKYGKTVDAYQNAAGLSHAPRNNQVLKPGETRNDRFPTPTKRDGTRPQTVEVRVGAVVLDGNVPLGEAARVEDIFSDRRLDAENWDHILVALKGSGQAANGVNSLKAAAERLDSPGPKRPYADLVRANLLSAVGRAEKGQQDAGQALDALMEQAQQSADAARKFSVPANR